MPATNQQGGSWKTIRKQAENPLRNIQLHPTTSLRMLCKYHRGANLSEKIIYQDYI